MAGHAVDVNNINFDTEVIEHSKQTPVVVDFWAPWCAPCKVLKPILEKLALEYGGKFKLAKVNSDENMELAAQFGVRSIPDVRAFKDGRLAGQFMGALPESKVREFIDRLLPTPAELERARGRELRAKGDAAGACAALSRAIGLDPKFHLARIDLVELLIELRQLEAAERQLSEVQANIDYDARIDALRAAIAFARSTQSGGASDAELRARIASNPGDLDARMQLANRHAGHSEWRAAMDELLEIVKRDRNWNDQAARKQMLAIFNLAAGQTELVSEYRRSLASALY
ncbi:MAG: thioredoxin [Betaproteobacteria bacterium]|nr:thioredoxin [Betaproteobacteria bacterium]